MKKFRLSLLAALLMFGLFIPATTEAQVVVRTRYVAPGVVMVKTKPVKPGRNYVWVDGHWHYDQHLRRQVWVDGYWMKKSRRNRAVAHRHATRRCH